MPLGCARVASSHTTRTPYKPRSDCHLAAITCRDKAARKKIKAEVRVGVLHITWAILLLAQGRPDATELAPYIPSSPVVVNRMLTLAKVDPKDVGYDLGCGDGRIVIAAAKQYGARGVGVDIDPRRINEAIANARKAGV